MCFTPHSSDASVPSVRLRCLISAGHASRMTVSGRALFTPISPALLEAVSEIRLTHFNIYKKASLNYLHSTHAIDAYLSDDK